MYNAHVLLSWDLHLCEEVKPRTNSDKNHKYDLAFKAESSESGVMIVHPSWGLERLLEREGFPVGD